MKFSIVIPVFNNWKLTNRCLKDLSSLNDDHEIIVVNNGSSDNTKEKLESKKFHPNLKVINNDSNQGFGKAVNLGYQASIGKYVMFLNNDIRVIKDYDNWTDLVISDSGLVGPTVGILDKDFNFITEAKKKSSRGHVYMSGWNVTANRKIWEQLIGKDEIGPFSTEFFVYFEDTDLGMRARELEIPFHLVNVPVKHLGKMTSKTLGTNNLFSQARKIFINKWTGRADKILNKVF